jgi:biotin carboxyl carrier protein
LDLRIGSSKDLLTAEVVQTSGKNTITVLIDKKVHEITLLRITSNEIEFIMDNRYHRAKIIGFETQETRLLVDDVPAVIKKHPMLQEILKKSLSDEERGEGGDKDIKSQIPGRVVNILAQIGSPVKKGDPIVVLESMKMQVAVKAHKDGKIRQIKVNQGATVARYDVIASLE